ncbi:MAG: phytanoyl-CoA dioxygenase family protein [Candidatus Poribacteria bacterium]|nr:phytanoyl-CoA dioxygenase family protein [Candidatus Poribacteria bacterium]
MSSLDATVARKQLIEEGYVVFPQVLDAEMLRRTTETCDRHIDALPPEHFAAQRSTGTMIGLFDDPFFTELVAYRPALDALASMGFERPTFSSGYVISKPPQSPPLFWHQDWWGWNDPHSYQPLPQQLFLMYYLVDTTPHNGCLRLIPRSHLYRHAMHDIVPDAHTDDLRRAEDLSHPAYNDIEGQIDVTVKAGDLVIGDSRILHASRANQSDTRRTVITLWFHPIYDELPEAMRAAIGRRNRPRDEWAAKAPFDMARLIPTYEGDAEPLGWNRIPGDRLSHA